VNRRWFLKYAGATATAVGASALGLDFLLTSSSSPYQITKNVRSTITETKLATQTITASAINSARLWEANFAPGDFQSFKQGVDASVGCPTIPASSEDTKLDLVMDGTSPQENKYALQQTTNIRRIPGLLMNVGAYRDVPFLEDSVYRFGGFFRVVDGSDTTAVTLAISRVENYVERFAELMWLCAPEFGDQQGAVLTRNPTTIVHGPNQWECTENCEQVKLWKIPPDNKWHYFEIEAQYTHDGTRKIVSMRWDSLVEHPNLIMGQTKQAWNQSFTVQCQNGNVARYFKLCGNYMTQDSVRYAKLFVIQKQLQP